MANMFKSLLSVLKCRSRAGGYGQRCERWVLHGGSHRADRESWLGSSRTTWGTMPNLDEQGYRIVPVKYPYVSNIRWAFMRWADIADARDPSRVYLRRLRVIQTPMFALYLHFIYLPDDDRDPHDHPWTFHSFIINGGYTEQLYVRTGYCFADKAMADDIPWCREDGAPIAHGPGTLHVMPTDKAHRIITIKPNTVTLIFGGQRNRQWGFWTPERWVDQETYREMHR